MDVQGSILVFSYEAIILSYLIQAGFVILAPGTEELRPLELPFQIYGLRLLVFFSFAMGCIIINIFMHGQTKASESLGSMPWVMDLILLPYFSSVRPSEQNHSPSILSITLPVPAVS